MISAPFEAAIPEIASRFLAVQRSFRLTSGRNAYPERTVSHFYIEALRKSLGDAEALLEVPIHGKGSLRKDNHLDALVFNETLAVLCEFKRVWGPSHWQWLAEDVSRLGSAVVADIAGRFQPIPGSQPRKLVAFFGADCWRESIAEVWRSGVPSKRWVLPSSFQTMTRGTHTVWRAKGEDYDGYYLTWAIASLRLPESA